MLKFLRNGDAITVYIFSISKIILTDVYSMREDIKKEDQLLNSVYLG